MIIFSFNAGNSSVVWQGFSLHWYEELFQDRAIMQSVYTTLLVSLLATVDRHHCRHLRRGGLLLHAPPDPGALMTVNNIPMTNADIVTGVSCACCLWRFSACGRVCRQLPRTLNWFGSLYRITLPKLSLGFGTMLIAHITFNIPYVILSVGPKLRQMDRNLVDAAQDLGCTWMQAFFKVILPEIKPGIISGALIAFTMSVDDFVISYFTAGSSVSTLAIEIYGMARKRISPEINAVSTLLFVVVMVLLVVINIREARADKALAEAAANRGLCGRQGREIIKFKRVLEE